MFMTLCGVLAKDSLHGYDLLRVAGTPALCLNYCFQADGDTALYVAAKAGHDEAVRALLEVPATKVNWQNHKGS